MSQNYKNDLISVIIPAYNREKTIHRAVKSVINQTYKNLEIIVVDDCSTDNTVNIVQKMMEKEPRLQLLINSVNQGPNYTRNRGLQNSHGNYLSLLDSDDKWQPETIEILWNKLKDTSEKIGLVYPGMRLISGRSIRIIYPKYRGNVFRKLMTKGTIGGYPLIKRKVFQIAGYFDESQILRRGGHQDYEMWIRVSRYFEFDYVNNPLLDYFYNNSQSITYSSVVKNPINKIRAYIYIWKKYKPFIEKDTDVYCFYCYKIFELFCRSHNKKWAHRFIFSALKVNLRNVRTYYHLIFYLHDFYSPINFLSKIHDLAVLAKERYERLKFRMKG